MARSRFTLQEQFYYGVALASCFVGLGACILTAAFTDSAGFGIVAFFATVFLTGAATEPWRRSIERRKREAPPDPPSPEPSAEELRRADASSNANMAIQIIVLVAGTYFRAFWLIALLGLGTTVVWLRHRESDGRGTAAWLGLFVGIYGLLGWIVVANSR